MVTLLNIHKPRDRSHYERFAAYHESFYRSVEATSVTPFSPRALDRGLAGTLVALARQGHAPMTRPAGRTEILARAGQAGLRGRGPGRAGRRTCRDDRPKTRRQLRQRVRERALDLLDEWRQMAPRAPQTSGVQLQYQTEIGASASGCCTSSSTRS